MSQEYCFPVCSTSVFILNLFLWFPDYLDLHGCSSIFGKLLLPQTTVLLRALPSLVSCPSGSALQGFFSPSPSYFPTTVIPTCKLSSNSC